MQRAAQRLSQGPLSRSFPISLADLSSAAFCKNKSGTRDCGWREEIGDAACGCKLFNFAQLHCCIAISAGHADAISRADAGVKPNSHFYSQSIALR
jgi:hypothetical protein